MEEVQMNEPESERRPPSAVAPNSSSGRGEKIAKIAALVSAVMASSCCWLPLLLLAVGISGAGIAATLEAYRPMFIVVTFGFLAAAFYFTYRPRRAVAGGAHDCCSPQPAESTGGCCATPGKGRLSVAALNKLMLWGVTALAVAFLLFPNYVGVFLGAGDGETATTSMNRASLKVEGMTCEGCAALVKKAIRSVPGVLAVEVDYQKGQAVVGTEPCCPVPREGILAALEKAGYTGSFPGPRANAGQSGSQTMERTVP